MRKWSKQGFLNPADSNDDGWFKFSVRPRHGKADSSLGLGIQFIISDCSNKIYLEFEPNNVFIGPTGKLESRPDQIVRALQSIKERRKKIRLFAKAVADAAAVIEENLDDYESKIITLQAELAASKNEKE